MSELALKTIQVKYFASLRETVGMDGQTVQSAAATVQALCIELAGLSADHAQALAHPRLCVAVNQVMAKLDATLSGDDEVAFFPPVTGG